MPLGMEVGLGPGDFVFDGDPATPRKKGHTHPIFGPWMSVVAKWQDGSRCLHLLEEGSTVFPPRINFFVRLTISAVEAPKLLPKFR